MNFVKYNDIHNWLVCRGVLEHEKHHARYASVPVCSIMVNNHYDVHYNLQ